MKTSTAIPKGKRLHISISIITHSKSCLNIKKYLIKWIPKKHQIYHSNSHHNTRCHISAKVALLVARFFLKRTNNRSWNHRQGKLPAIKPHNHRGDIHEGPIFLNYHTNLGTNQRTFLDPSHNRIPTEGNRAKNFLT